jgi:hypothetical protein
LHRNGTCEFRGYFANEGPVAIDVAVVVVVRSRNGHDYPFSRALTVPGAGEGSGTTATWDAVTHEPGIAADWPALVAGGSFDADASASLDVPALLGKVLQTIVGAIGRP